MPPRKGWHSFRPMKRHPSILIVAWLLITATLFFGKTDSVRLRLWESALFGVSIILYVAFPSRQSK